MNPPSAQWDPVESPRPSTGNSVRLPVKDYDLEATLTSGQTFRWSSTGTAWEGVVSGRWVRLTPQAGHIHAETAEPQSDWLWLEDYLQTRVSLQPILDAFPDDAPMRRSVEACRGLRLLRQDHWECLASFILSSTKQIVQIRQITDLLCRRFGEPIPTAGDGGQAWSFPTPERLAACSEAELRDCKMGFRAPYLLQSARTIADGKLELAAIQSLPLEEARSALCSLPGVGPKIADCVLLFAYDFPQAFPVDVWVHKALSQLYFSGRKVRQARLRAFADTHFKPFAGYAQQYLFHYMRTQSPPVAPARRPRRKP